VGTWTKDYKIFLDELLTKEGGNEFGLKNFDDLYNDVDVKFILYFKDDAFSDIEDNKEAFEKNFKLVTTWKTTNMCCFVPRDDKSGVSIQKFTSVGDILEKFVETRLPAYEERRLKMLEILVKEMKELDAKKRFVQAILDGTLVLMRKSDEDIVESLKECDIPPLSDPDLEDEVEGYEYVLRMRIDRVKASAIDQLDEEFMKKKEEVEKLEKETPNSMWLNDLEEFETAWKKYCAHREEELTKGCVEAGGSGGKKKKVTMKKK
jgi:DNA topoisomerase-2